MRCWELIRCAGQAVIRSRLRSCLTAAGIAIAAGALVSMVALAIGLQRQVEAPFKLLGLLNNIEVRPKLGELPDDDVPPAVLDDRAVEQIELLSGVEYAYPDFRLSRLEIRSGDKSESVFAIGLPREATLVGFFGDLMQAGTFFSLSEDPQAVIGEALVDRLGFATPRDAIGQPLRLVASGLADSGDQNFTVSSREMDVRIVGVYRPPSFATGIGADAILLPVDLMKDLPGARLEQTLRRLRSQSETALAGYPQVIVHVNSPSDVFRVQQAIREMGFETRALVDELAEARSAFIFLEVLLASVGTVALVVAGLGIVNTLLMTVLERQQEIGLYKAIGASDGDVRLLFLTEAGLLGLAGGVSGLALARVVSAGLQWAINGYAATQGVPEPGAVFSFPWWLLAGAVAFAVVVSILSGLYPASRAARLDPIQALRS